MELSSKFSCKTKLFFAKLACPNCFTLKPGKDPEAGDLRECQIQLTSEVGNAAVE